MSVTYAGPVWTGRFEEFVISEDGKAYTILCLADRNNQELQAAGQSPAFYWVPGDVRIAKDANGTPKFNLTYFTGSVGDDDNAGVDSKSETTGGVLAFTTTSRPPTDVLKQAEEQILAKFRGDNDRYWGIRTTAAPRFAIAPITRAITMCGSNGSGRGMWVAMVPPRKPVSSTAPSTDVRGQA